jgi:hypothetical protein
VDRDERTRQNSYIEIKFDFIRIMDYRFNHRSDMTKVSLVSVKQDLHCVVYFFQPHKKFLKPFLSYIFAANSGETYKVRFPLKINIISTT